MDIEIRQLQGEDLSVDTFTEQAYATETPLLVRGVNPDPYALTVMWMLATSAPAKRNTGHIATSIQAVEEDIELPVNLRTLVRHLFARQDTVSKPLPVKLWMQPRGHTTHLHYDGNSLHGLNWQISGRKDWLLVSPDTPPPMVPMTQIARCVHDFDPDPTRYDFIRVQTRPGDLLFVPRYWSHQVCALERVNANINWVWSPTLPNPQSRLGLRECAVLQMRNKMGRLNRLIPYRVGINDYASAGTNVLENYVKPLSRMQILSVFAGELANTLAYLPLRRRIDQRLDQLATNNFRNFNT